MVRLDKIILSLVVIVASAVPAAALPEFLELFRSDPFRRTDVDGCAVCHLDPSGGGDRNAFGLVFEDNQYRFTPMMRAAFPDRFAVPTTEIDDGMRVHFADPENGSVVIELGGETYLVDLASRSIPGLESDVAPQTPARVAAAEPAQAPDIPVDDYAREGAFFGSRVVNLSNAKPMEKGGVEFLIGHRFTFPLFDRDSPSRLFGFDTGSRTTLGFRVGVTDRLSVSFLRGNQALGRTIEFASAFQVSRQGESGPLSMQVRAGVEGRNNFQDRFAPFLQLAMNRTYGDRVSFAVAPSIAFNTRDEKTFLPPDLLFGADHDYTASVGVGLGLRLTPTVSVVGELVPRVAGFKGERFDRPAVSFGVQKATFRHTFQFVVSTAAPMTTAQYTVNGTDTFTAGFNIYRRLR